MDRPGLRGGPAGPGDGAGKHHAAHQHAVHGAEKGRRVRPGGGLPEPAERLYGPVLPGAGGLHAAGRLHLRHSDHPLRRPGERLLPLRRLGGELLPAGAVRRRHPGADPGGAGGTDPGGLRGRCGGLAHRPAGAAAEERLPGHRHPGLRGDHPGHLPVGRPGPCHQRRQRPEELPHLLQLQYRERQWRGGVPAVHLRALPAGGGVHRHHGAADQLHLRPGLQGHPGGRGGRRGHGHQPGQAQADGLLHQLLLRRSGRRHVRHVRQPGPGQDLHHLHDL